MLKDKNVDFVFDTAMIIMRVENLSDSVVCVHLFSGIAQSVRVNWKQVILVIVK